jgi:hypothetical protein
MEYGLAGGNGLGVAVVGLESPHPAARITTTSSPANLANNDVSTGVVLPSFSDCPSFLKETVGKSPERRLRKG